MDRGGTEDSVEEETRRSGSKRGPSWVGRLRPVEVLRSGELV